ncbi:MAG: 3-oxoacyl-ACP reductase FabG [Rhizobiales bacterium]|nr:3-oxoacyl-ACP reductase FabG [Hyphomicrobiales bacterium]
MTPSRGAFADFRLSGRHAAVTGAASGIGRAIARAYAAAGARVALLDRDLGRAEDAAAAIRAEGGDAAAFGCDVAYEAAVAIAFAAVRGTGGPVDILVNNAGVLRDVPFTAMTSAEWDRVMAVNLRGAFLCTREVVPDMQARRYGRIVNIASQLALKGAPQLAHYVAAKAGLIGLTKALAHELARDGIAVNALAPGITETAMSAGVPDEVKRRLAESLQIGRLANPEDLVGAALLLASDAGSYVIGATLNVNGGDVMG